MMYYFSLRTKMEYMRLMSYNCQSFNSNLNIICSLLSSCDILCLQETLICEQVERAKYQQVDRVVGWPFFGEKAKILSVFLLFSLIG